MTYLVETLPRRTRPGLARIQALLERLGIAPDYPILLVGGTNGKGSVCAMVSSGLMASGLRVGSFLSPHLVRVEERVRIDWRPQEFSSEDEEVYPEAKRLGATFFEAMTAIAVLRFQRQKVDFGVFEVGMGGRLDATNALPHSGSAITSISLDHTRWLGKSVEEIAREKAGIMTQWARSSARGKAARILREEARKRGTELTFVGVYAWREGRLLYRGREYVLGIPPPYEAGNAALAVELLRRMGVREREISKGLASAFIEGRFQRIGESILDGAHNLHGVLALVRSLRRMGIHLHPVFAVMRDKDWKRMLAILRNYAGEVLVTSLPLRRSAGMEELARVPGTRPISLSEAEDLVGGPYLFTGSLYFIGHLLGRVLGRREL